MEIIVFRSAQPKWVEAKYFVETQQYVEEVEIIPHDEPGFAMHLPPLERKATRVMLSYSKIDRIPIAESMVIARIPFVSLTLIKSSEEVEEEHVNDAFPHLKRKQTQQI